MQVQPYLLAFDGRCETCAVLGGVHRSSRNDQHRITTGTNQWHSNFTDTPSRLL